MLTGADSSVEIISQVLLNVLRSRPTLNLSTVTHLTALILDTIQYTKHAGRQKASLVCCYTHENTEANA